MSSVVCFSILCNLAKIKVTFRVVCMVMLASLVLGFISYLFYNEFIAAIFNAIFLTLFAYRYTKNGTDSLLLSALSLTLLMPVQSVVATTYSQIFGIPLIDISYYDSSYWIILVMSSVFAYMSSNYLGKLVKRLYDSPLFDSDKKSKRLILLSITAFSVVLLIVFFSISFTSENIDNIETLQILNTFLLFIVCTFVILICYGFFKAMFQSMTLKHHQELVKNLQEYNISIENLYTEMRHFRHDTVNILSTAYRFIENDNFEAWKDYFEKEVSPLYKNICQQSDMFKQFEKISSDACKGFLMLKTLAAIDAKCTVSVGIEETHITGVSDIDMIRMLGIIFDNAIDEGRKNEGTNIRLVIFNRDNSLTIHISNQFYGEPPNIAEIYQNGYSTKGKGRGVGLCDLRRLVDNHDTACLQTFIDEDWFVQELNFGV